MPFSFHIVPIYIPLYIVLLIASAALSIFSYRKLRGDISKTWLIVFIALRTLLFFFVFSALFSLIIESRFSRSEKPSVLVLLDSSGSMQIESDGTSRTSEAKRIITDRLLPFLNNQATTEVYPFSDKIYSPEDSTEINRGTTMLGNVLKQSLHLEEKQPSALFLISDGRNTGMEDPVETAEKLPFPVFCIKVGKKEEKNNITLSSVRVNPIVYKGDTVPITALVSNSGPERKNVTVQIRKKGQILDTKKIAVLGAGVDSPIQLSFVPQQRGLQNYEVRVQTFKDESNSEDNKQNITVKVLEKRKKVVLLTYHLNWDYRFLKDFLLSQNDIEAFCYARIGKNQYLIKHGNEYKGNLNHKVILDSDVLILINPEKIEQSLFANILTAVEKKGLGVLIIGNMLPDFSIFRTAYPFVASTPPLSGDFIPQLTQTGQNSPLFMIRGISPPPFPPLSNPLRIKMVKPATEVYLETETKSSYNGPLFGSFTYGKGKIAAFTAENIWHWKMLPLGTQQSFDLYDEVMNNMLKWLAARKEEERLVLFAAKTKLLWGEPITISAALYDEMMKPTEGGTIILRFEKDEKDINEFLMKDVGNGNYEKTVAMLSPGIYRIHAEVTFPEDIKKRESITIEITSQEIENLNTEPDHLLLDNIARASNGRSFSSEEQLSSIILKPHIVVIRKKLQFSNAILILLLISLIFLLELTIRRIKGLK